MPPSTIADLAEALRRFPVLAPEQLAELPQLEVQFPGSKTLARELMQRGWLTAYQANQLLQGRGGDLLLGSYILQERLGEGGMGAVFKARHRGLGRIVALKIIRKERLTNPDAVRRFLREARAVAQLSHPNVVLAFDADCAGSVHYLAMEYVEGIDLAKLVKQQGPLSISTACDYVRQAALGLQHAHERGLVHRDIKPANLLLTSRVGSGHDGPKWVIKVLDMGLALLIQPDENEDASTTLTRYGSVMGSLDFMAPEQAKNSHNVDIRADIYSLGCTLYYLLTGRVPFPGGTPFEKMFRHQTDEPAPVEQLRPEVPADLAVVVRKLLAKRPEDRYQTPAEVADALAAMTEERPALPVALPADDITHVDTEPFAGLGQSDTVDNAGPPSQAEPAPRNSRLVPFLAGGLVLASLLAVIVFLGMRAGSPPVNKDEKVAEDKGNKGEPVPPVPPDGFVSLFNGKDLDGWEVKAGRKQDWAVQDGLLVCKGGDKGWLGTTRPLQNFILRVDWRLQTGGHSGVFLRTVNLPSGPGDTLEDRVVKVAMIPRLVDPPLAASLGGHLWLFTPGNRSVLRPPRQIARKAGEWNSYEITFQGDQLTILLNDELVVETNSQKEFLLSQLLGAGPIGLENSGTPAEFRNIFLKELASAPGQPAPPAPSGVATLKTWTVLKDHTDKAEWVAIAHDGKTLASSGADRVVRLWDLAGNVKQRLVLNLGIRVAGVDFRPDGTMLAAGSDNGILSLWRPADGMRLAQRVGHTGGITAIAFSPDGKRLASGGADRLVRLWNPDLFGTATTILRGHTGPISMAAWAPDSKLLVSVAGDGWVSLWDAPTGTLRHKFKGHTERIECVAFAPSGFAFATTGFDNRTRLWTPEGELWQELVMSAAGLSVAFSPDGRSIAVGGGDGKIRLWDLPSGRLQALGSEHTGNIFGLAFSPDGRTLASAGHDKTVRLWDVSAFSGSPYAPVALDLLSLIDPDKDRVKGQWRFDEAGKLHSDDAAGARLRIPYRPADEYDLRTAFTVPVIGNGVDQILSRSGRQFGCVMGGWNNTIVALETVAGLRGNANRTTARWPNFLQAGRRHETLVQVRKEGVTVFLDGVKVTSLATDYSNLGLHYSWWLEDPLVLGLGSYNSPTIFHRVEVVEVFGRGTFTRPDDPAARKAVARQTFAPWRPLFNGRDLQGWQGILESKELWSVVPLADEPALRMSGARPGFLTLAGGDRQNYHLRLDFKWPAGALDVAADITHHRALAECLGIRLGPRAERRALWCSNDRLFGAGVVRDGRIELGASGKNWFSPLPDLLRPAGEWNRLELLCVKGTTLYVLNGKPLCVMLNPRRLSGGQEAPIEKGGIGIGSAFGEVFYRRLEIRPLSDFPPDIADAAGLRVP